MNPITLTDSQAQRLLAGEQAEWVGVFERLQAVVDRLPHTADGVPVTPGMALYAARRKPCGCIEIIAYEGGDTVEIDGTVRRFGHEAGWRVLARQCYSTREAADAAEREEG